MDKLIPRQVMPVRLALLVGIGGSLFYWYGYRPEAIRTDCEVAAAAVVMAILKTETTPAAADQKLIGQGLLESTIDLRRKHSGELDAADVRRLLHLEQENARHSALCGAPARRG